MSFYSYKKDENEKPGHAKQATPGFLLGGSFGGALVPATLWQPRQLFYLIKPPWK